eukprot:169440-Chlamydomonas_euryale.AAC.1
MPRPQAWGRCGCRRARRRRQRRRWGRAAHTCWTTWSAGSRSRARRAQRRRACTSRRTPCPRCPPRQSCSTPRRRTWHIPTSRAELAAAPPPSQQPRAAAASLAQATAWPRRCLAGVPRAARNERAHAHARARPSPARRLRGQEVSESTHTRGRNRAEQGCRARQEVSDTPPPLPGRRCPLGLLRAACRHDWRANGKRMAGHAGQQRTAAQGSRRSISVPASS